MSVYVPAKGRPMKYVRVPQSHYLANWRSSCRSRGRRKATVTSLRFSEQHLQSRDVEVRASRRCRGTNIILDVWWYQPARIESYMFVEECTRVTRRAREVEIHSTYSEFDIDPINQRSTWRTTLSVQSPTSLWVSLWVDLGDTPSYEGS